MDNKANFLKKMVEEGDYDTLASLVSYNTATVAKQLGIGVSTVNKYVRLLEAAGYEYYKDDKGIRSFTDYDIKAFRAFIEQKEMGKDLETAAIIVKNKHKRDLIEPEPEVAMVATPVIPEAEVELERRLAAQNHQLFGELVRFIEERDKEKEEKEIERLEERDRLLMDSMRETLEVKKLLLEQKNMSLIDLIKNMFKNNKK